MRMSVLMLGLILAGCGNSEEDIFKENCEDLLKISAADPFKVSVHRIDLSEGVLARNKAEELAKEPGQTSISPSTSAAFDIWYGDNKNLPRQIFVQIEATDAGKSPRREKAICRYYSDETQSKLVSASLFGGKRVTEGYPLRRFLTRSVTPRHMDVFGNLRIK